MNDALSLDISDCPGIISKLVRIQSSEVGKVPDVWCSKWI